MKKIAFILTLMCLSVGWASAQTSSPYYIVGTPATITSLNNLVPGFNRFVDSSSDPDWYSRRVYLWFTSEKKWMLYFMYCDLKPGGEQTPIPIEYKTLDYFNTVIYPQAYDLDKIMATNPTGESVEQWALQMKMKRIYFIDRNEITATQVKLIPVFLLEVNNKLLYLREEGEYPDEVNESSGTFGPGGGSTRRN